MTRQDVAGRRTAGMTDATAGGGTARHASMPYVSRGIPDFDILDDEALAIIEVNADKVLEEIGVNFADNPAAVALWKEAGAEVLGERVRLPAGLARTLCATAPARFTQHARNPARNVRIGGRDLVAAPVYGPPFVCDAAGGRRLATIEDFRRFVKLGQMSDGVHHSGGTLCEPTDVAVNKRHLDMLHAHMTLSDKPYMGSVTLPGRAADSVEMSRIMFGADFVDRHPVMTSLISINSPLSFDPLAMGALEVHARAGQAVIISPFIICGATAPPTVAGALTQLLAEMLAGAAYNQLIRPGAPVILGPYVASIDRASGAPGFGTPEATQITLGAGQLVRRLGLPYRGGGALCGARLPDAQAAGETAAGLSAGLLSGANFMLNACGWLEGGLVASYEKFVLDADQLGVLRRLAAAPDLSPAGQALDMIGAVGPGGHYLGRGGAGPEDGDASRPTSLMGSSPLEAGPDESTRERVALATRRVRQMLDAYSPPALDPGIAEALAEYVARRKAAMPDAPA